MPSARRGGRDGAAMMVVRLLALPLWWWAVSAAGDDHAVSLKLKGTEALAQTGEDFLCGTMDWWPKEKCDYGICAWTETPYGAQPSILNMDLTQPAFQAAIKRMSPFYLRLGGSLQDFINYDMTSSSKGLRGGAARDDCPPMHSDPDANIWGFNGGCLNASRWEEAGKLCVDLGCKLIFGLNELRGREHVKDTNYTGKWDPSNTRELLQYTKDHDIPVYAFELGNELGGWNGIAAKLTPEEVADDFVTLGDMIKEIWPEEDSRPHLLGPDTGLDMDWFPAFLSRAGPALTGVTIHLYALGPGVAPNLKETIMNPNHTQKAEETAQNLTSLLNSRAEFGGLQKWMGEDGGAYNSGQNGTSNRFMAGFWSLSELGLFAKQGFHAYCRQTFLGGNYGLLDKDTLVPNPDFFNFLLFKTLMGPQVLFIEVPPDTPNLRAYAHCTSTKSGKYGSGSVTVLLLNFDQNVSYTVEELQVDGGNSYTTDGSRHDYLLTSPDILNATISLLNGNPLKVSDTGEFPELTPVEVTDVTTSPLIIPAHSYGFFVFPDADVAACA